MSLAQCAANISDLDLYRPIADLLLLKHNLTVVEEVRDALASGIVAAHLDKKTTFRSPTKALRSARAHALKLLAYAGKPPPRKARIGESMR